MAVELVAGAFLSSSLQFLFEMIGSGEVMAYLRGKSKGLDLDELVGKLKIVLTTVMAVIDDAEKKQRKSKSVEVWLDMLQEVVFDAEDLMDLIETDARELKEKGEPCVKETKKRNVLKKKFKKFFLGSPSSDDGDMGSKVKKLLERFEFIANQKDLLGLEKSTDQEKASWRLPSTSLVDEYEVYGRDYDKGEMIKFLLFDYVSNEKTCVISIWGMGGIGKTTLAQTIYNDNLVKEHFEIKAWVSVSEEFDVCRVTKTILMEVTSHACDVVELNSLQLRLKESLSGKKFLIVLDDVWHEKSVELDVLCLPFKDGAQGSKIIVTTRSEKVASSMRAVKSLNLQNLSKEASWKLFSKEAFNLNDNLSSDPKFEEIGREIVNKCNGLPLALRTLGGLLRSTLDVEEWKRILESDIWDLREDESNILPALKLSHHFLPSQLKRCFAYCSIFPKDYEFEKDEMILLWMAENLLERPKRNRRIEDVGQEYFNCLVSRSIFQRTTRKSTFVMHDLIHDLAKYVSGEYYFHLEDGLQSEMNVNKVHHLGFISTSLDPYKRFNNVLQATKLRTFLPQSRRYNELSGISMKVVNELLLKLGYLRVLSLSRYKNIYHLPDSIGELRHLHYLDLSYTKISMLPESLCNLFNLQTLKLYFCTRLKYLPAGMHHLINLRNLDLRFCNMLVEMPVQLSKLKNLQMLSTFIVGKDNSSKIEKLRELSDLRGKLSITRLENVGNTKNTLDDAKLMNMKHLDSLSLIWSSNDDSKHARDVLDMLLPSRTLKNLHISGYSSIKFPKWFVGEALGNVVSITLTKCMNCTSLPPLGQLPSLKILKISCFDFLVDIGPEFYGDCSTVKPFQSLELLKLSGLYSWERWFQDDSGAFAKLIELGINHCSKLIGALPCFLPSLTKLNISICESLTSVLPKIPCIYELNVTGCGSVMLLESCNELMKQMESCEIMSFKDCSSSVVIQILISCLPINMKELNIFESKGLDIKFDCPHISLEIIKICNTCDALKSFPLHQFPKLKQLVIGKMESLESLSMSYDLQSDQTMISLTSLDIYKCSSFVSFPKGGLPAPNLTRLMIEGCNKLKALPEKMHTLLTSLKRLQMYSCPEIESFSEDGLPSSLTKLEILDCDKLIAARKNWCLKRLPNLITFIIKGNSETVESFPEDGLLPTTITELIISGFPCLKSMDKNMLRKLTSLEYLLIEELPMLQKIPREVLSGSLKYLCINRCDKLQRIFIEDHPTSLETLRIQRCRNFQIIIEKGLPTSLKHMHIDICDELQSIALEGLP